MEKGTYQVSNQSQGYTVGLAPQLHMLSVSKKPAVGSWAAIILGAAQSRPGHGEGACHGETQAGRGFSQPRLRLRGKVKESFGIGVNSAFL